MEMIENIGLGFTVALSLSALFYCFAGVTLGTLIGVLPGIGPLAAIGVLLPITFHLPATEAIIMLAGMYYGSMYGGSTVAILMNVPGTASSAVVALDGYPMAKQGRAGHALVLTTFSAFAGGTISMLVIAAFAPVLAAFALRFGSPESFSLMLVGLLIAAMLTQESMLKGIGMVVLGLLLGVVGQDSISGLPRFTFEQYDLYDGISFVVVTVGLFGIAEIIKNLLLGDKRENFVKPIPWRQLIPARKDVRASIMPTVRGSGIGCAMGVLPGAGPAMSSFTAYAVEKRISRTPEEFGRGSIAGISAPEGANNAAAQTGFIPTLTLGIPGDTVMALMMGALMIHGVIPGPDLVTTHPDLFWGLVASFWIGNLLLLLINLPFIGLWIRLLSIPYHLMYPTMVVFIAVGVYTLQRNPTDVYLAAACGVIGYMLMKLRCEAAPLLIGLILSPLIEFNLRRSMMLSGGDPSIFIERPISLAFIALAAVIVSSVVFSFCLSLWRQKKESRV